MSETTSEKRLDPLTRDKVLSATLHIIDTEGVNALSMRRLAAELGRDPMRLYAHAENKEALLDAVVAYVLQEFSVAKVRDADWEGALRETAHRLHRIAIAHPRVVPLLVTRGLSRPMVLRPREALEPAEDLLELFAGAGFDARGGMHATRVFIAFLQGQILSDVQEVVDNPEESEALLRVGLQRLPLSRFPRLRGLAAEISGYDDTAALDECLDTVLTGIRADLARQPDNGQSRRGS